MKNIYKSFTKAFVGCTIKINRWLIGSAAAVCKNCNCQLKIDDSSIDYETDTIDATVTAPDNESYINCAFDMHRDLGVDLL